MRVYVLRRLVQIVPTVLMITFVVFLMMQSIPGDPVVALVTRHSVQELPLAPGSAVTVSFKASAVHLIERGEAGTSCSQVSSATTRPISAVS